MTLLMLLVYMALGALLAWPCWLLLQHRLRAHEPLRCVQPYRPHLPPEDATDVAASPSAPRSKE